jgi:uncharacterized BrkB/YihY/UPF0761 family membrane protein
MKKRPNFLQSRLRGLLLLVCLGGLFLVASGASGLVSGGVGGPVLKVLGIALSLALNFALFMVSFRVLTVADVSWQELVPGALFAAIGWELLQVAGGLYINHVVRSSSNTYGTFAFVIGVLAWLHLGAQLSLYAAEINVVLARRLYPRCLLGPPEEPADQKTLTALAKVEERSDGQRVEVQFGNGDGSDDTPAPPARTTGPAPPAGSSP